MRAATDMIAALERGSLVGLAVAPSVGVGLTTADGHTWSGAVDAVELVGAIERAVRPRWVVWSARDVVGPLVDGGLCIATAWDVAAVHRLLFGGWRAEPARAWAAMRDLASATIPALGQLDLLGGATGGGGDAEEPVQPDGHLRPEWTAGGWRATPARLAAWAGAALTTAQRQSERLGAIDIGGDARSTARSESAAELLCVELAHDGLPIDLDEVRRIITDAVGDRPTDVVAADASRRARDAAVLAHAPLGAGVDLRNPAQVRALLRQVGVDVPDTRAWRLEPFRDVHPLVDALLTWRKAERIATTYGWGWLDAHVGTDGRLRGAWSGSDGAAGRMTADAGLHNLPTEMRPAVAAEPGFVFVRADLGQIEPRVLAAVSGDASLARATQADDLYAPVAKRLGVERAIAKVGVLAAMYGQTSGVAGQALRGLDAAYPVAMGYLRAADERGRAGDDVRTHGGRLVRMGATPDDLEPAAERAVAAARGRYARNAMVQGAAAELFKAWSATVRARAGAHGASIVLCLHDELLVHAPEMEGDAVAALLHACLAEASGRWAPGGAVRFVADVSIVRRWSDAKG
jgi:DNA polymerase I